MSIVEARQAGGAGQGNEMQVNSASVCGFRAVLRCWIIQSASARSNPRSQAACSEAIHWCCNLPWVSFEGSLENANVRNISSVEVGAFGS